MSIVVRSLGQQALKSFVLSSFIREDEDPQTVSYEERLARAYESKLFKEYALVCHDHTNCV